MSEQASNLRLVPFDETYRDLSFDWLRDPELARLTRTPSMTREAQQTWFAGLADRSDYAVWGLECDGAPVGAAGLRGIGVDGGAESFLYIADPQVWGRGLGGWVLDALADEARRRGLTHLRARVGADNPRSVALHRRHGFDVVEQTHDEYSLRRAV